MKNLPIAEQDNADGKKGRLVAIPIQVIAMHDSVKALMASPMAQETLEAAMVYPPFFLEADYDAVIKGLDQVLELLPDDEVILGKKGNCLETQQKYEEALAVYEIALTLYPTFLPNMYNKVFCLERLNRNEECNEYFDEILKHYPYEVKALANKGKILKRLHHLNEGLTYCEKALKLNPKDFSALFHKAAIEEMLSVVIKQTS